MKAVTLAEPRNYLVGLANAPQRSTVPPFTPRKPLPSIDFQW